MYMIAVCDDEAAVARYIAGQVRVQFDQLHRLASVDWYTKPEELERRLTAGSCYDSLLLDIDMPGLDGIEFCRRLRQWNNDALLVFISNKEELVFQTFASKWLPSDSCARITFARS